MNSASVASSKRLQRVRDLLKDGNEYTTMQIVRKAKVCATCAPWWLLDAAARPTIADSICRTMNLTA